MLYTGFRFAFSWARLSGIMRSEEHTSELQSHLNLVCRLLLYKKKPDSCAVDGIPDQLIPHLSGLRAGAPPAPQTPPPRHSEPGRLREANHPSRLYVNIACRCS